LEAQVEKWRHKAQDHETRIILLERNLHDTKTERNELRRQLAMEQKRPWWRRPGR
jgi:hypothetical protein